MQNEPHCPHDNLFKNLMTDRLIAEEFFKNNLPLHIRPLIDYNSLTICSGSYVDDELQTSSSDILYKAKIAGQVAYIYLLCEHQSSVDSWMPFRLWQYIIKIWTDHRKQTKSKKLPLVIPLVFYNGENRYDGSLDIRELIDAPLELIEKTLFKPFHLIDTNDIEDETLRKQHWAGVMCFVMKHIYARDFIPHIALLMKMLNEILLNKEIDSPVELRKILLKYIVRVGNVSQLSDFIDQVKVHSAQPFVGEDVMNIEEAMKAVGRKEGRQEGRQEAREMLVNLLEQKFTIIPPFYRDRIEKSDISTLLKLANRILTAKSIEQIFADMVIH